MPMQPWLDDTEDTGLPAMGPEAPNPAFDTGPQEAVQPAMDPKVKQYMMDKYFAASNKQGVVDAQNKQQKMDMAASIGDFANAALNSPKGGMALAKGWNETGPTRSTTPNQQKGSLFDPLRQAGSEGVQRAQQDRASNIQDFDMENKLSNQARQQGREDVQDARQVKADAFNEEKHGQERLDWAHTNERRPMDDQFNDGQRDRTVKQQASSDAVAAREADPMSDDSIMARDMVKKMGIGINVDGMSAAQLKAKSPAFETMYKIQQDRLGRQDRLQAMKPPNPEKQIFDNLPKDKQEMVTGLARKNADKEAIANSIDATLSNWDKLTPEQQLQQGRQLIKTLNSTEGKDAVGAEEAKRLAGKLEIGMGGLLSGNTGQFGRDLPGFKEDATITSKAIRDGIKMNQGTIDTSYGRTSAPQPQAPVTKLAPVDSAAVEWAKANPNDPRAAQILKQNGM